MPELKSSPSSKNAPQDCHRHHKLQKWCQPTNGLQQNVRTPGMNALPPAALHGLLKRHHIVSSSSSIQTTGVQPSGRNLPPPTTTSQRTEDFYEQFLDVLEDECSYNIYETFRKLGGIQTSTREADPSLATPLNYHQQKLKVLNKAQVKEIVTTRSNKSRNPLDQSKDHSWIRSGIVRQSLKFSEGQNEAPFLSYNTRAAFDNNLYCGLVTLEKQQEELVKSSRTSNSETALPVVGDNFTKEKRSQSATRNHGRKRKEQGDLSLPSLNPCYESLAETHSNSDVGFFSECPNSLKLIWSISNDKQSHHHFSDEVNEPLFSQSTINSMNSLLRVPLQDLNSRRRYPPTPGSSTPTDNYSACSSLNAPTVSLYQSDDEEIVDGSPQEFLYYYPPATDYDSYSSIMFPRFDPIGSARFGGDDDHVAGHGCPRMKSRFGRDDFDDFDVLSMNSIHRSAMDFINFQDLITSGKGYSYENVSCDTLERPNYLDYFGELDDSSLYEEVRKNRGFGSWGRSVSDISRFRASRDSDLFMSECCRVEHNEVATDARELLKLKTPKGRACGFNSTDNEQNFLTSCESLVAESCLSCSENAEQESLAAENGFHTEHAPKENTFSDSWTNDDFTSTISTVRSYTDAESADERLEPFYDRVLSDYLGRCWLHQK